MTYLLRYLFVKIGAVEAKTNFKVAIDGSAFSFAFPSLNYIIALFAGKWKSFY